jgi:predicted DNA-binding protein YlxM (UPF0122 family)
MLNAQFLPIIAGLVSKVLPKHEEEKTSMNNVATQSEVWTKPILATDVIRRLHIKLSRTAKALKLWEKARISNIKSQLAVAKEVLWQLDQAHKRRNLSQAELVSKRKSKMSTWDLSPLRKCRHIKGLG